jgi:glycogen debranching enzyme
LRVRFEEAFWCEEIGTYALALDASKRPCEVRASNAGHCLAMGIASTERARRVADLFMTPEFFSGWGVRTVASGEARYNPMSYHNGSVWPHDNSLIVHGFSRYGLNSHVKKLTKALFDASILLGEGRLPELFCGFPKRMDEYPVLYPVACSPQAWASAVWCLVLQSCLGLEIDAVERKIYALPVLPDFLDNVTLHNVRVGADEMTLLFRRQNGRVTTDLVDASKKYTLQLRHYD